MVDNGNQPRGGNLPNRASTETLPNPTAVASKLERLATSNSFRKAPPSLRLLRRFAVHALEGRDSERKGYTLGVTVSERPASHPPRTDLMVRLEACQPRPKLAEYCQQEGLDDLVIDDLPESAYLRDFRLRRVHPQTRVLVMLGLAVLVAFARLRSAEGSICD
jgi:hypothetical protein